MPAPCLQTRESSARALLGERRFQTCVRTVRVVLQLGHHRPRPCLVCAQNLRSHCTPLFRKQAGASGTSPPGAPAGRSDARSQHSHPDGGPAAGGAGAGSHSNASSGSGNTSSLGGTASATSRARRWANWTVRRWVTHCGGGGGASATTSSGAAAALPKNPAEAAGAFGEQDTGKM